MSRSSKILLVVALGFGYAFYFPYLQRLGNPNENVRVYQVIAMVDHGTFAINTVIARYGRVSDRATNKAHSCPGKAGPEACTYSGKAPGASYWGVPFYLLIKAGLAVTGAQPSLTTIIYWLRILAVILPSLAFLWWFARFLKRYVASDFDRYLAVSVLGLGSMSFTYAHLFASHQLVACALFGSFMLVERARERPTSRWPLPVAGLCAYGAAISEYPAFGAALALHLFALWRMPKPRWRTLVSFGLGAVLPAVGVLVYHQLCFGAPWRTGYSMLANADFERFHAVGVLGFEAPTGQMLREWFVSPRRGLLFFCPFLILGVAGLAVLRRQAGTAVAVLCGFIVGFFFFTQACLNTMIGGWTTGPRYLCAIVPYLVFAGAVLAGQGRQRWPLATQWVTCALALVSIGVTFTATIVFYTLTPLFANPFFDFVVPLVKMDHFHHNQLSGFGLRGLASAWPGIALSLLVCLRLVLGDGALPPWRRLYGAAGALVLAAALFTWFGIADREATAENGKEVAQQSREYEPSVAGAAAVTRATERARAAPADPAALAAQARLLARAGQGVRALVIYRRAAAALRSRSGP